MRCAAVAMANLIPVHFLRGIAAAPRTPMSHRPVQTEPALHGFNTQLVWWCDAMPCYAVSDVSLTRAATAVLITRPGIWSLDFGRVYTKVEPRDARAEHFVFVA
jgi:hypothetical protein